METRTIRLDRPLDLGLTLAPLRRGGRDPSMRIGPDGVWRATRTPDGPATTHLRSDGAAVTMRAWGQGASWAIDGLDALIGERDCAQGFVTVHPLLADLHRRHPGLRLPASGAVVEALVPTILEQKVIGLEARRSYVGLVRAFGEPAPGPAGLRLPPTPAVLARTPSYVFHRFGVERKRADTVRLACSYARRLDEARSLPPAEAQRRLQVLPGIGPWTAAEVARVALGDPDAVSVGDYHLPSLVSFALAGEPRGDDARMLELLEPYRGQRARVLRLLEVGGPRPPRYGPTLPLQNLARI